MDEKEYYGLSCWGDPYNRNDTEHFLVGPYETRAQAKKAVERRLEHGQPKGFRDWFSGSVRVFDSTEKLCKALDRLKLRHPKFDDYYIGEPVLIRLRDKGE